MVHIHAHFQLVVGDDLTKSYRVPLEAVFLGSARPDGEFFVPAPELELILLVVRLTLKHLTWDAVVTRRARIPASARSELADLESRSEPAEVERRLEQALPFVRRGTFEDCRLALAPDAGKFAGIRAGGRLLADLTPCARRSRAADVGLKFWRRGGEIGSAAGIAPGAAEAAGRGRRDHRHRRRRRRRKVDGGRGTRQAAGQDLRGGSRAPRQAPEVMDHPRPPEHRARTLRIPPGRPAPRPPGTLARDGARGSGDRPGARPLPHRRAIRRIATNGGLVLCDRFPLPELKLMDGPRVERVMDPIAGAG